MLRSLPLFTVLLLASAAAPTQAQAPVDDLEALLARFRALEGLEVRFREERTVALIATPLVSEGRIYFLPPGRFYRRVESPEPSSMRIADGQLVMRDGDREERMPIDTNPVLQAFLESFRAVLAGDGETLERFYRTRFSAGEDGWTLRLTPRSETLARFVREIVLEGDDVRMRRMVIREVSGDVATTTFRDLDLDRRFSPAERRRLFGG